MALNQYMQLDQFREAFTEFASVSDTNVQFYLDTAQNKVNPCVFVNFTQSAHGFYTAHLIATSPYGMNLKLMNANGDTDYLIAFNNILRSCAPTATVANSPRGTAVCRPSGGGGGSSGNVTGPSSSTDSAIALFNGETGKVIKNSLLVVDGYHINNLNVDDLEGELLDAQKIAISLESTLIGTKPKINFIQGPNIVLDIQDDTIDNEIDITISSFGAGTGDVTGPSSATDNALVRFDNTTGKLIQNSNALLSDSGVITLSPTSVTPAIVIGSNGQGQLITGLNSDQLDSQDGSYYTNASNLASGTLPAARFDDTAHGSRSGGSLHSNATTSVSGFMSGSDKSKLDNLPSSINLDGYALSSIIISAGSGLSGGGNLTANRTISLQQGLLDGYATTASLSGYVPTSRTVTAGSGLIGGGSLSSNITIGLTQGLLDGYALSSALKYQTIQSNGSSLTQRSRFNFIPGSNISLSVVDDSGNDRTNITITSTGGGSGSSQNLFQTLALGNSTDGYNINLNSGSALISSDGNVIVNDNFNVNGVTTLSPATITAPIILSANGQGQLVTGLNADQLDSQDGTYYTNASNLAAGTIPAARFDDTSHGSRSGGTLHSVATSGSAGFMSATDKSKIDAISLDGYVPVTRTVTAGAGMTGGGALSSNITLNVVANGDGSIVVNADDIQVGILATDAQHGNRGGGSIHSDATTSVAGFMSAADKQKINAINLDGYALSSISITAGSGLSGGGNLTTSRTISLQQGLLDGYATTSSLSGYVPTSRTVSPGSGMTGGGALSSNITIGLTQGLLDGYALSSSLSGYVPTSRTVTAGTGLTGGGALSSNLTISLTAGLLDGYAALTSSAPADVTKATAVVGVATTAARADHKHNISTATASTLTVGGSNAEGSATSLARSDHTHALPAFGTTSGTFCQGNDSRLSDDRTASGIRTATTVVATSSATAPADGYALIASSTTAASWIKTPSYGIKNVNNAQTGTTYTLALTDSGKTVTLNNGSAITLTVPTNASVPFEVGTIVNLIQLGAGLVTVAAAGGVTVSLLTGKNLAFKGQYAQCVLTKVATDQWILTGENY